MRVILPRLLAASLLVAFSAHAAPGTPPQTPKRMVSETLAGVPVNDPYRWLENPEAADVKQWIEAQNTYTESTIGAMPLGKELSARIRELAITSTTRSSPTLAGGTLFYFENTPPQPQGRRREGRHLCPLRCPHQGQAADRLRRLPGPSRHRPAGGKGHHRVRQGLFAHCRIHSRRR